MKQAALPHAKADSPCHCHFAFTLIEILICTVIIAILITLILPLARRQFEASQVVKCLSNIKQLGQGILLFTQDHNGMLPPSEEGEGAGEGAYPGPTFGKTVAADCPTWAEFIFKSYLDNNYYILACPSLPVTRSYQVRGNHPDYGYNQRLSPINTATGYRQGMRLSAIAHPSQMILLGESGFPSGKDPQYGYFRILSYSDLDPRHLNSKVNVLYVDWHAETQHLDFSTPPKDTDPLGRNQFVP